MNEYKLELIDPPFNSKLTDLIIELNYLRKKNLFGSTKPYIFFQLKHIFHFIESIGSARIEGNNTTIAEYVENEIQTGRKVKSIIPSELKEIKNLEDVMEFIEENIKETPINKLFISEIHKRVVEGLPTTDGLI